jgi:D-alanyl-D-alanine carboxypeptidase
VLTWGLADTARTTRITGESLFPVGSVTKTLVTVRALQLVEEGRLRLEDTVEKWLPGMLPTGDQVTVEQLLSHRAGLSDAVNRAADWPIDADWTPADLKQALAGAGRPDVRTHYSNAGFNLVGLVLEEVGDEPLELQLAEHVFAPAGMNQTSIWVEAMHESRLVHGYDDGGHDVTPDDLSGAWASGAAVSTARDLDRFFAALFSYRLLEEATVADMTDPRGELDDGFGSYGLGLWVYPLDCGDALGHDGAIAGYRTAAFRGPDDDRSIVVMINTIDDLGTLEAVGNAALCPRVR